MTYIKTGEVSFTTQSSVSIDNCFSAAYTHYLVVRNLLGSVSEQNIAMRLRASGADDTGTNYRHQSLDAASTSIAGARATGQTGWNYALGYVEASAFGYQQARISNPFEAVRTTAWSDMSYDADGNIILDRFVFAHDLTTSYDGLTVIPNSGTITGRITVYGLKSV